MKNRVEACIDFSFKGQQYSPCATIDLDALMENRGDLALIYDQIARENAIDPYSYEYEVLESSPIRFDRAQGLAEAFVYDGRLDLEKFATAWQQARINETLLALARKHLNIQSLDEIPGLRACLLEVWQQGQSTVRE